MLELMVFVSAFFSVFLLGFNSKVLRDDRILLGAIVSFFITASQFALTWAVVHANLSPLTYLLCSGIGGSIGITCAQYAYIVYAAMFKRKEIKQ